MRGSSEILLRNVTCKRPVQHGPVFKHNEKSGVRSHMRVCEKHNVSVGIARPHGSQRLLHTQACLHKSDPGSSSSFSAHRGHRWASHSRVLRTVLRTTKSEPENLFPAFPSTIRGPSGTRVYLVGVICAALDDDGGHSKSRGKR